MVLIDTIPMVFLESAAAAAEIEKFRISSRFSAIGDVVDLVQEMSREDRSCIQRGLVFAIGAVGSVMISTFSVDEDTFERMPVKACSILRDPIRRTIKRVADTEGVFLLNTRGQVVASGRYPRSGLDVDHVRDGDTRYRLAMTVTDQTMAYAVVLAHNGNVLLYRLGGVISEIVCPSGDFEGLC